MAGEIRIEEAWDTHQLEYDRFQRLQSAQVIYKVFGAAGEVAAISELARRIPLYYDKSLRFDGFSAPARIAADSYKIGVKYQRRGDDGWGTPEVRIDVASQMITVKTAIRRLAVSPNPTGVAVQGRREVNISERGEVLGVQVPMGYTTRTETYYVPMQDITTAYEKNLNALVGSINGKRFRGYEPGEVRFDGAYYQYKTTDEEVAITFKFSISPNDANALVGSWLIGKRGWDYGWVKFKKQINMYGMIEMVPDYAVVDQVLRDKDFRILKIGS